MKKISGDRKYTSVRKLTDNRFLNLYEMDALSKDGAPFHYYFASRNREEVLPLVTGEVPSNGIVIYALCQSDPSRIVMIRQYRYPLDAYLYELPAGLIDQGETAEEAAVREMQEETGLIFSPCEDIAPCFRRPYFLGAGLTDETSTSVFGYVSGDVSGAYLESTEDIEVLFVDKEEAKRILNEERVSLRAAFLLTVFMNSDENHPFSFFC